MQLSYELFSVHSSVHLNLHYPVSHQYGKWRGGYTEHAFVIEDDDDNKPLNSIEELFNSINMLNVEMWI